MKKVALALAFVVLMIGGAYAKPASMAVTVDTGYLLSGLLSGGFGIGGTFEYDFLDNVGASVKFGYVGVSILGVSMSMIMPGVDVRFYPLAPKAGLYAFAGFQYWLITASYLGYSFSGGAPLIDFGAGYKWVVGGESGFVVEPYIGYALTLGASIAGSGFSVGGLEYGIRLGYAF